jgi:sulfide:quinone oxidoreductase
MMPGAREERTARPHVLVAGGGIAGTEALLGLRELAGARVRLTLVSPEPALVLRPLAVAEPFGTEQARHIPLAEVCKDTEAHLVRDAVARVDPQRRTVVTDGGRTLGWDAIVLAPGARARSALPGAVTFDGRRGIAGLERVLDEVVDGDARRVAFAVADGVTWSLPLYELALMTAAALDDADAHLVLVTPENEPLGVFGSAVSRRVRSVLEEAGVELRTGAAPLRVEPGSLVTADGEIPADRVVALPVLEGPRLEGVPLDAHGFIPVDEHSRVLGVSDVYAAGDGTSTQIKQGGLAAQQADAAAEHIAAAAGAPCSAEPFRPVLRAQLLTGALPVHLRAQVETGARPGEASIAPLWWPAGKIAARYLAPYLAGRHRHALDRPQPLRDLDAERSWDVEEAEAVRDLALVFADEEAADGAWNEALHWLEAAEALRSTLPRDYVAKRVEWQRAAAASR